MEEGARFKVYVVDQSAFARVALPRLIEADPQLEVCGVAANEEEAFEEMVAADADVVVLHLAAAPDHGIALIREVMFRGERPILLLLSHELSESAHLAALEAGAVLGIPWELDPTPSRLLAFQTLLTSKLKAFAAARAAAEEVAFEGETAEQALEVEAGEKEADFKRPKKRGRKATKDRPTGQPRDPLALAETDALILPDRDPPTPADDLDRRAEVVVLGSGAGGMAAFREIVRHLPAELNTALLGVMRMPDHLLRPFADRLSTESALKVVVAREGDPVKPGMLMMTPADSNLGLVRTGRIPKALVRLVKPEPGIAKVPSIDSTCRACAAIYGAGAAAVVISGLSQDGVDGLRQVQARGGITAALELTETVVPNTNRLCVEAGVTDQVLSTQEVVTMLIRLGQNG